MPANSVYVQKQGEVYTVQVGDNGQPIPVATVDDQPLGAFPFTFNSKRELEAHFPGRDLIMLERQPSGNPQPPSAPRDPLIDQQVEAFLKANKIPTKSTKTIAIAAQTGEILPSGTQTQLQRVNEFKRRLETALQYASKKHQRDLEIQIKVLEELIHEVFEK